MARRILAAALLLVVINFLWWSDSAGHVKVAMAWLVVDIALWLPELNIVRTRL